MTQSILTPMLALVCWTLVMWIWMYARRIPAMQTLKIDPQAAAHPGTYSDKLPASVRAAADNYNHLHEQPTIFYALIVYSHLAGVADPLNILLAWTYVALRVVHSLVQVTVNRVVLRFFIFAAASITLMVIAVRNVLAMMV